MNQMAGTILGLGLAREPTESLARASDGAFRQLREEYQAQWALFDAQPLDTRRFLQAQAVRLAEALAQSHPPFEFNLPDQVVSTDRLLTVPAEFRKQVVGGLLVRVTAKDIRAVVRQRLAQLEQSPHQAVAVCAKLIRYATVKHMVHDLLPDSAHPGESNSADPVAPRFFMPQWVAFDDDRLLVDSVTEAQVRVARMQQYLRTLHLAVSLAPYIFADEDYQRKRVGMLGQLVNQGRALARYWTSEIIGKIQRRAAAHQLDRGLNLSLPYFDDQMLEMKKLDFEVIPHGRTMFIPAFVVLAVRREQSCVEQDARLSQSTRMHLLSELKALEHAFESVEI